MKKELPIDLMSNREFEDIRKNKLNSNYLDGVGRTIIRRIFDLPIETSETEIVKVNCDEAHAHSYSCLSFSNRSSAVVLRLLDEIEKYQDRLDKIKEEAEYRK